MPTKPRRRQAGEGRISEHLTQAGPRFLIKYSIPVEDGTRRAVLKRGFRSRRDAAARLRIEIDRAETGAGVKPSKQRLDAYRREWVSGERLSASTLASYYRKNIRLHIDPYLGETPLARITGAAVDAWMRQIEVKGNRPELLEGPTKTGQARVVGIDPDTVAALEAYRAARGRLDAALVRDSALVLSGMDGAHRHPERFSRRFAEQVVQARRVLGEDELPRIRLHDLRHTHATLLLTPGEPVKVVPERLGHANATITLTVYQHVHPGMGRQAAERYAALLRG